MRLKKADCVFSCWNCDRRVNGRSAPERISAFICPHCDCITQVQLAKSANGIELIIKELEPNKKSYRYKPKPKVAIRKVEYYPPLQPEDCKPMLKVDDIEQSLSDGENELNRLKLEIEKMRRRK